MPMLGDFEEPPRPDHASFWHSAEGFEHFQQMVQQRVGPEGSAHVGIWRLRDTYAQILVGIDFLSDAVVHARAEASAAAIAEEARHDGLRASAFSRFCNEPHPPRHAMWYGASDQSSDELAVPVPANAQYASFLQEARRNRAPSRRVGMRTSTLDAMSGPSSARTDGSW